MKGETMALYLSQERWGRVCLHVVAALRAGHWRWHLSVAKTQSHIEVQSSNDPIQVAMCRVAERNEIQSELRAMGLKDTYMRCAQSRAIEPGDWRFRRPLGGRSGDGEPAGETSAVVNQSQINGAPNFVEVQRRIRQIRSRFTVGLPVRGRDFQRQKR
jgi:hypothetical protein